MAIAQRSFTQDERMAMAKAGKAMPNGDLPTPDKRSLRAAIHLYGKTSNPDAAKTYLKKRAKDLNALYLLPNAWRKEMGLAQSAFMAAVLAQAGLTDFLEKHPTLDTDAFRAYVKTNQRGELNHPELQRLARTFKEKGLGQDDGAGTDSGGLLSSVGGTNPACPTCGQPLGVGVKAPSSGPTKKKRKFASMMPNQSELARVPVKQSAAIVQWSPISWNITTVVQSPSLPHLVELGGEVVELTWSEDCIKQAAYDFLRDMNQNQITMHHAELAQNARPDTEGTHGTVVASWVSLTCEDIPAGDGLSQHVPKGTWLITYHAESPALRSAILQGDVNAVSLTTFAYSLEDLEPST